MAPNNQYNSLAIVLDSHHHGESDKITTFICPQIGKLTGIAKGANRSKQRFVNKLELFSFIDLEFTKKENYSLAFLTGAELKESFINIRKNIKLYSVASVIRELTLMAIAENNENNDLFSLIIWALQQLELGRYPVTILILFQIKFYASIGYSPDFSTCTCDSSLTANKNAYRLDNSSGRLLCSKCQNFGENRNSTVISNGTIKMLQTAQQMPYEKLHRLKLSGTIVQESLQIMHNFGRHIFQRNLRSWKIMIDTCLTKT